MLLKRAGESKKSKSKTHRRLHPHDPNQGGGGKAAGGVFQGGVFQERVFQDGGKEGGGAEGAPKKSSMQMAREALFALLRAAQVLAPGLGLGIGIGLGLGLGVGLPGVMVPAAIAVVIGVCV